MRERSSFLGARAGAPRLLLVVLVVLAFATSSSPALAATPQSKLGDVPFPNDVYAKVVPGSATGRRVALKQAAMPANAHGLKIDPHAWNEADGFSPAGPIVVRVPGLDTAAAFKRSRLVGQTEIPRSLKVGQTIALLDAASGKRVAFWSEIDTHPRRPADRSLLIHPAATLPEGRRYLVALRGLRGADGRALKTPAAALSPPRRKLLLAALARRGVRSPRFSWVWDFTVASRASLTQRALKLRDAAFATLGDRDLANGRVEGHSPDFSVDEVTAVPRCDPTGCSVGQDAQILREVRGTFDVPCYLHRPDCGAGGRFSLGRDGLPRRVGDNVMKAPFTCIVPRAALTSGEAGAPSVANPLPAVLYGHDLLSSADEVASPAIRSYAAESGSILCATDSSGMAEADINSLAPALLDLHLLPTVVDRVQQGLLDQLFLARLLRRVDGFAGDAGFQDADGHALLQTASVGFLGVGQGATLGGALTALAPDFTRSVLYAPGMAWSMLWPRSAGVDLPDTTADLANVLQAGYPSAKARPLILALMQMLWDRAESSGYARAMTGKPLPGSPEHQVLLEEAFGDHDVANIATQTEARTIGLGRAAPTLAGGRSSDPAAFSGIAPLTPLPADGSALVVWDAGPLRSQGGATVGTPAPPSAATAPVRGEDPHEALFARTPALRRQIASFLSPAPMLVDVCGGAPCHGAGWSGASPPGGGTPSGGGGAPSR